MVEDMIETGLNLLHLCPMKKSTADKSQAATELVEDKENEKSQLWFWGFLFLICVFIGALLSQEYLAKYF